VALLCFLASGVTSTVAAREPLTQLPGISTTPAENVSGSVEEAAQLQADADTLIKKRQFESATEKTERALAIRRRLLGDTHPDVAYSLSQLGNIAYEQGQYEPAEARFTEALAIRKTALGLSHVDVAQTLNDLATIVQLRGDYVRPEAMYQEALRIYERALASPPSSPLGAIEALKADLHRNLGRLYNLRGDYKRAETQYLNALKLREALSARDPGPNRVVDVAQVLADLGGVYYSSHEYENALRVLPKALAMLPANHPSVATASNNLALVYLNQGKFSDAIPLFKRALSIYESSLPPQHPRLATPLINLAEALRLNEEYAEANPLNERALSIRERSLGSTHPQVADAMIEWSLLRYATSDVAAATELMSKAAELREDTLALVLTTGSEEQKRLYLLTLIDETDIAVSFHLGSAATSPDAARLALTNILRRKGRSIDAMADQFASLRRHLAGSDRDVLNGWAQARSRLANVALKGVATEEQRQSVTRLRGEIEEIEQRISARSVEFKVVSEKPTLAVVANALPVGTALIEFFAYRPFSVRNPHDTAYGPSHYVAYVLRRDGIAAAADLGDAAAIEQHVRRFRSALSNPSDQTVRRAARVLHRDLIAPIQSSLKDADRIIVSPDGVLNLIPFSALVDEQDTYLAEHLPISYVTSGRDLMRFRPSAPELAGRSTSPVIVASPLFTLSRGGSRGPANRPPTTRSLDSFQVPYDALQFEPLPETRLEAKALATVLPDARVYTGADATEAVLKGLSGPTVLHIATHGFFLQSRTPRTTAVRQSSTIASRQDAAMEREEALVRSGLALAGANERSSGADEDGLLTGLEVAGLDLWGTRLVVLSACETGVGDARNGEGVYGLRRALVMAGSESQVMSLWKVSDTATRDLMIAYYQRLRAHEARADALQHVQVAMLHGPPNRAHPFYWAAFIESGDWRPAFD